MSAAVPWFELTSYLTELAFRRIQLCTNLHFLLPVAMICFSVTRITVELFGDWRNPDGGKSHALNVVQLDSISRV